jgi:hypothetical protein
MENSMGVITATDSRRTGGVPISLKWLSFIGCPRCTSS